MSFFRKLAFTWVRRYTDNSAEDINELKQQLKEKEREIEAMRLQQNQEKEEMKKEHRNEMIKLEAESDSLEARIHNMVNERQEYRLQSEAEENALIQRIATQYVEIMETNKRIKELKDNLKEYKKQFKSKVNPNGVPSLDYRKRTTEAVCICAVVLLLWWFWYILLKE
jgi:chromosome segregation ATPase